MIKDIQEEIIRLKKERGAVILAHCYQTHDILEVADYVGDSFGLAQNARKTDAQTGNEVLVIFSDHDTTVPVRGLGGVDVDSWRPEFVVIKAAR